MNETNLSKMTCPKGHDVTVSDGNPVTQPYGAYRCPTCQKDYAVSELMSVPLQGKQFTGKFCDLSHHRELAAKGHRQCPDCNASLLSVW